MVRQLLLSLRITWQNFMAAKMRTSLTVLGIIVGIAAVMIVMSVGASAQNLILDQIRSVGANLIAVLPGYSEDDGPPASMYGTVITTLTSDDLEAIRKASNVPGIAAAAGYVTGNGVLKYKTYSKAHTYQGVSAEVIDVENMPVARGRFFTSQENDARAKVAVVGATIARDLFDNSDPLGKVISLGGKQFRVVGVLKPKGASMLSNFDGTVYVPLATAQKDLLGISYVNFIRMRAVDDDHMSQVEHDVDTLLRSPHDIKDGEKGDYSIRGIDAALDIVTNITNIMKYFLVSVAGVSLLVGGIGVMNIMFIALSQRIREIGLRKALGARRKDITVQFLFEAAVIAIAGGVLGFLLGLFVIYGVAAIAHAMAFTWGAVVTGDMVLLALGIAVVLGVSFGVYPALRAADVSPMEALRYE